MSVKLLTEHHLEFLSFKGCCTVSSEATRQNATLLEITCHGSYSLHIVLNANNVAIAAQKYPFKVTCRF